MLRLLALYTALSLGANPAAALDLSALKTGEMKKMVVYDQPLATPDLPFVDAEGGSHSLRDFRGQPVLLNFWATWCAPCRAEMPALDRAQADLGSRGLKVLTLATGRNPQAQIGRFFDQAGVVHLPRYQDEPRALARAMGVAGLPVSVLIDREGHEVARIIGEADWDSAEARAVLDALTRE
ncbi:TlpA family protein disulfide reductase [Paenirhodobacter populi]|uniref:TlpA family protein disulfide reductase n=1 Tax=Paenirhodobacter populi TaxID=2306993 RepID=A0A443J0A8_9RHOB|nr:TlpA disulfide reductase family protein [Sinirhodobacter populi]RWR13901.1 TlpA family protein disulfide reductase [Sinirhodobacter populi]